MRRKDKEINNQSEIYQILNDNIVLRLGFCLHNKPYVLSMNFAHENNCIYLHCAKKGKKIDIIKENNNACFHITDNEQFIEEELDVEATMKYRSVIGEGKIYLVSDFDEKKHAVHLLMKKHTNRTQFNIPEKAIESVQILKIIVSNISGKKSKM